MSSILFSTILFSTNLYLSSLETRKLSWKQETLDEPSGMLPLDKDIFEDYLTKWNSSINSQSVENTHELNENKENVSGGKIEFNNSPLKENHGSPYIRETEIENIFHASTNDSSMILSDMTICLTSYNLMDCLRMFILNRLKTVVYQLENSDSTGVDYQFLNGLIKFKWNNETNDDRVQLRGVGLNEELHYFVHRLFKSRALQVAVLPGFGVEFTPRYTNSKGDLCFSAKLLRGNNAPHSEAVEEMRKKGDGNKKKKKGGFSMMPMMMIPQMIMMGMMPFALANLKSMVMNALMMNTMALNGAIFMTIRNLVFGPRKGEGVKYVNYGYNKKVVDKKPTLVLHSPAAFVTKPKKYYPPYKPPNINEYDNPNTYQVDSVTNNQRKNMAVNQNRPMKTDVEHIPYPPYSPYAVNSLQPNHRPHFEHPNKVDAQISYLNNNQYLQPSHDPTQITKSQSYSYELTDQTKYESYPDQYSTVNKGSSRIDDKKSGHASKYSNEDYDSVTSNYYANHRPNS